MLNKTRKPFQPRELTEFGRFVKLRLLERRMTSVELCNKAGIPNAPYLSKILYGDVSGDKYIAKIMDVLEDAKEKPK